QTGHSRLGDTRVGQTVRVIRRIVGRVLVDHLDHGGRDRGLVGVRVVDRLQSRERVVAGRELAVELDAPGAVDDLGRARLFAVHEEGDGRAVDAGSLDLYHVGQLGLGEGVAIRGNSDLRSGRCHGERGGDRAGLVAVELLVGAHFVLAVAQVGLDAPGAVGDLGGELFAVDRHGHSGAVDAGAGDLGDGLGHAVAVGRGGDRRVGQHDVDLVLHDLGDVVAVLGLHGEGVVAELLGSIEGPRAVAVDLDGDLIALGGLD